MAKRQKKIRVQVVNFNINKDGNNPLHIAIKGGKSEDEIIQLINTYPDAAAHQNNGGSYPLHFSCTYHQSLLVVKKLYALYKPAIKEKDYNDRYPLHLACRFSRTENAVYRYKECESVVLWLLHKFPQAVQEKDDSERYPLDLACIYKEYENVILQLLYAFPQAVKEKRTFSSYPLHSACAQNHSERVVLALLESNLMALKVTYGGESVLTTAIRCGQSSTIVQVLEELITKSDYYLQNRVNIPKVVRINGLDNVRRTNIYQGVLYNSPKF